MLRKLGATQQNFGTKKNPKKIQKNPNQIQKKSKKKQKINSPSRLGELIFGFFFWIFFGFFLGGSIPKRLRQFSCSTVLWIAAPRAPVFRSSGFLLPLSLLKLSPKSCSIFFVVGSLGSLGQQTIFSALPWGPKISHQSTSSSWFLFPLLSLWLVRKLGQRPALWFSCSSSNQDFFTSLYLMVVAAEIGQPPASS